LTDQYVIKIDEPTLKRLETKYGNMIGDMDTRLANYQWDGGEPNSTLTLSDPFPMRLGGADFTQAEGLANALDKVRQNLVNRFDTVYENGSDLYWGLQFLLADSNATENLATMTAQQFDGYIPTDSTQGSSGDGPTQTNPGTS
jgi:hypothetical protein